MTTLYSSGSVWEIMNWTGWRDAMSWDDVSLLTGSDLAWGGWSTIMQSADQIPIFSDRVSLPSPIYRLAWPLPEDAETARIFRWYQDQFHEIDGLEMTLSSWSLLVQYGSGNIDFGENVYVIEFYDAQDLPIKAVSYQIETYFNPIEIAWWTVYFDEKTLVSSRSESYRMYPKFVEEWGAFINKVWKDAHIISGMRLNRFLTGSIWPASTSDLWSYDILLQSPQGDFISKSYDALTYNKEVPYIFEVSNFQVDGRTTRAQWYDLIRERVVAREWVLTYFSPGGVGKNSPIYKPDAWYIEFTHGGGDLWWFWKTVERYALDDYRLIAAYEESNWWISVWNQFEKIEIIPEWVQEEEWIYSFDERRYSYFTKDGEDWVKDDDFLLYDVSKPLRFRTPIHGFWSAVSSRSVGFHEQTKINIQDEFQTTVRDSEDLSKPLSLSPRISWDANTCRGIYLIDQNGFYAWTEGVESGTLDQEFTILWESIYVPNLAIYENNNPVWYTPSSFYGGKFQYNISYQLWNLVTWDNLYRLELLDQDKQLICQREITLKNILSPTE